MATTTLCYRGRKIEEELHDSLVEKDAQKDTFIETMTNSDRLLLDLQCGIATLYEKLKNIRLKPVRRF